MVSTDRTPLVTAFAQTAKCLHMLEIIYIRDQAPACAPTDVGNKSPSHHSLEQMGTRPSSSLKMNDVNSSFDYALEDDHTTTQLGPKVEQKSPISSLQGDFIHDQGPPGIHAD
jgi:hypothetical protein